MSGGACVCMSECVLASDREREREGEREKEREIRSNDRIGESLTVIKRRWFHIYSIMNMFYRHYLALFIINVPNYAV